MNKIVVGKATRHTEGIASQLLLLIEFDFVVEEVVPVDMNPLLGIVIEFVAYSTELEENAKKKLA